MSDEKFTYKCANGVEQRFLLDCKNMKAVEGDLSMEYEHYSCAVCGLTAKLDYEEMR